MLTAAVRITDWPKTEGLAVETSDVVVASWLTVCFTVQALVLKLESPLYVALIVSVPTPSGTLAVIVTVPFDSVPEPSVVVPQVNVTEPVAVPPAGEVALTVVVSVSDWP